MLTKLIRDRRDLALLLLRLAAGVVFLAHGLAKFQGGIEGVAGFLGGLSIPAPLFFAWVLSLTETLGGAFLILGIFSRLSALGLAIDMVVAIALVKSNVGLIAPPGGGAGAELDLSLLVGVLAVLLQGPGLYSIELGFLKKEIV